MHRIFNYTRIAKIILTETFTIFILTVYYYDLLHDQIWEHRATPVLCNISNDKDGGHGNAKRIAIKQCFIVKNVVTPNTTIKYVIFFEFLIKKSSRLKSTI